MSEYQYYEFQAIDHRLTEAEQAEIRELSSRVVLTPTQAIFTNSFGDFRGNAAEVLARYFDALLYLSNWGTRRLMFRFPRALIPRRQVERYCTEDWMTFEDAGDFVLLDLRGDEEGTGFWVEGEGKLSPLIPLREDILKGDYRMLYLGWLKAAQMELWPEDEEEPPVPPGLRDLSPALEALIDLFEIDRFWIQVAARTSADLSQPAPERLRTALGELPRAEAEEYLWRLAQGDGHVRLELLVRLQTLAGVRPPAPSPARTVAQLRRAARRVRADEERRRAAEAEAERQRQLEALAQREEAAWQEVEESIQRYTARGYEDAVALLKQLHEVAQYQGEPQRFQERINAIYERYPTRRSLLERLQKAGLPPSRS